MHVLVVKLSSMGDIIHVMPAVTDATKAIPGITFDWVVEENFAEIPAWHNSVKTIIPIALRRWGKNFWQAIKSKEMQVFWHKLRSQKYDYVIDVQGLIKSAAVTRAAKGVRCGFSANNAREPIATILYQRKYDVSKSLHAIARARELFAKSLGYQIPSSDPDYAVNKELFPKISSKENYLMLVHGTSRNDKCWAEQNWVELAQLANTAGFKVKLPWGNNAELERAQKIAQQVDNAEVLPKLSLTELGALILNAKCTVAVDTGLGHLAAALDASAISLYGPTNPDKIGTRGKNQIHITDMHACSAKKVWQSIEIMLSPNDPPK